MNYLTGLFIILTVAAYVGHVKSEIACRVRSYKQWPGFVRGSGEVHHDPHYNEYEVPDFKKILILKELSTTNTIAELKTALKTIIGYDPSVYILWVKEVKNGRYTLPQDHELLSHFSKPSVLLPAVEVEIRQINGN
ncbi:hypothetical protein DdX_10033 [Ditylenchus destructor]|uniref:Uncharacterized protein n=1 Tax=Ditylenchus destructor TaxID=166010 RepID=A0AAD4MZQ7_9BILA|nr:hypothetical protein DdX_10033 [Ditylenchus destructor]